MKSSNPNHTSSHSKPGIGDRWAEMMGLPAPEAQKGRHIIAVLVASAPPPCFDGFLAE